MPNITSTTFSVLNNLQSILIPLLGLNDNSILVSSFSILANFTEEKQKTKEDQQVNTKIRKSKKKKKNEYRELTHLKVKKIYFCNIC